MDATSVRHLRLSAPLSGVRVLPLPDPGGALPLRLHAAPQAGTLSPLVPQPAAPEESGSADVSADQAVVNELLEEMLRVLEELEHRRRRNLQELQQAAVELAMLVTAQILQQQLEKDAFPIERLVEEALQRLAPYQPIEVRLHPQDLQILEKRLANRQPPSKFEHVRWCPDASLARGSCLADVAEFGLLSTLEQRLTDVRHCLLEGLEDAETERRQTGTSAEHLRRFPDRRETA